MDTLRDFLTYRPAVLRHQAEEYLGTPPSVQLRVETPPTVELLLDGHRVRNGFEGYYFPDMRFEVAVAEPDRSRLSHWRVNGRRRRPLNPLRQRATQETVIEAVLD